MNFKKMKNENWFPYTVATCSAVLLAYILMHLGVVGTVFSSVWKMASPLVAGAVIAYLVNPIAMFVEYIIREKFGTKRKSWGISVGVAFIFVGLLLILFLAALVPSLVSSASGLINTLDGGLEGVTKSFFGDNIDSDKIKELDKKLNELVPVISDAVMNNSGSVGGSLTNVGLGFILAIYFLLDKSKIVLWVKSIFKKLMEEEKYKKTARFFAKCHNILLKYISCSLLEAIIVGVANAIFMLVLRMPYVALISLTVGVTNLAPTFGPIIGAVIGGVILFLAKPIYVVYFLLFTVIIQTVDGYIIKPKLFGNTLGVSSLWILIAIICGGKLFGVIGVVFAIPFAAIVQYFLEEILFPRSKAMNLKMPWEKNTGRRKNDENN